MMISAIRLNHAVLFVRDLERSIRFYEETLGFAVAAREPKANAAFLRLPFSGNHHDLGLFGTGRSAERSATGRSGLYHLAWQVDTIDELVSGRNTLVRAGAYRGESSHGATKSLYGADPDGNEFEVMWMLPRSSWGEFANSAPVNALDLDSDVIRWSGVGTASVTPVGVS